MVLLFVAGSFLWSSALGLTTTCELPCACPFCVLLHRLGLLAHGGLFSALILSPVGGCIGALAWHTFCLSTFGVCVGLHCVCAVSFDVGAYGAIPLQFGVRVFSLVLRWPGHVPLCCINITLALYPAVATGTVAVGLSGR